MSAPNQKHKIQGVLFDLDGLLLDTEPIYEEAYSRVCSEFNKEYSLDVRVNVIGRGELLGAKKIVEMLNLPISGEELLKLRDVHLEKLLPQSRLMKGAENLTRHLKKHNIPIAVATSSIEWSVKLKFQNHKQWIEDVFGTNIITGGRIENTISFLKDNPAIKQGKPAPDIFLAAAKLISIEPGNCLVFEDSPSGVAAGKAAQMTVCSVPDPTMYKHSPEVFKPADYILDSLADVDLTLFSLPPL